MPASHQRLRLIGLLSVLSLLAACGSKGEVRDTTPAAVAITDTTVAPETSATADASPVASASPTDAGADAAVEGAQVDGVDTAGQADADPFAPVAFDPPAYDPIADPTLPSPVQMTASYDPWEGWNRKVHRFNNAVDRNIARPLAQAYQAAVPRPVRLGVTNFFNNLGQPLTALNALLQGKPGHAGQALGRFLLNSTLGIGGIFDPASNAGIPRRSEDFGQTLGVWGWKTSRYVELPLFGPRTLRDSFGLVGDAPLSPIRQVDDDGARYFLQGLRLVDVRAQLFAVDDLRDGASDEYALVRDAWLQRRNYQIHGDRKEGDYNDLPDYLFEDDVDNPTVPVDVMPIVPLSPTP